MKIAILSYFDPFIGPNPLITIPEDVDKEIKSNAANLIDVREQPGFFMQMIEGYQSANYYFEVPNLTARGGCETCLITMILTEGEIDPIVAESLMTKFIKNIQSEENICKALAFKPEEEELHKIKLKDCKDKFSQFYSTFPVKNVIKSTKDANIFVFGLSKVGKTSILQNIQMATKKSLVPTTNIGINRLFLNNLSMITYDTPGQEKLRNLWLPYIDKQNALVFVFDVVNKKQYDNARDVLHEFARMDDLKELPLLILLNKIDLEKPDLNDITDFLELEKLGEREVRVFFTSAKTNEGISLAFKWLTQILSKVIATGDIPVDAEKIENSVIFSRWDEDKGLELLDYYPKENIGDPDIIAIRCFSMAEYIYGGNEFDKKMSIIVPMTHLGVKAAIYFDTLEDKSVRGGKLLLSLVLIFRDKISDKLIENLNSFVFEQFEKLKKSYLKDQEYSEPLEVINAKIERAVEIFKEDSPEINKRLKLFFQGQFKESSTLRKLNTHKFFLITLLIIFSMDIYVILERPMIADFTRIEKTYVLFCFALQGAALLTSTALSLFIQWYKGGKSNISHLAWGWAFTFYDVLLFGLIFQALGYEWADMSNPKIFFFWRHVMILWAALMYYGIANLVTNNRRWHFIPTIIFLIGGYSIFIWGLFFRGDIEYMMYIFLYSIWVPICILIIYLFFLYSKKQNNLSSKILCFGFALLTFTYMIWAQTHKSYNYYIIFATFNLAITFIFAGYTILPYEIRLKEFRMENNYF